MSSWLTSFQVLVPLGTLAVPLFLFSYSVTLNRMQKGECCVLMTHIVLIKLQNVGSIFISVQPATPVTKILLAETPKEAVKIVKNHFINDRFNL